MTEAATTTTTTTTTAAAAPTVLTLESSQQQPSGTMQQLRQTSNRTAASSPYGSRSRAGSSIMGWNTMTKQQQQHPSNGINGYHQMAVEGAQPVFASSTPTTDSMRGGDHHYNNGGALQFASSQSPAGNIYTSGPPRYGEQHVLGERVVEHEVRVPRKVIREDIVERVIVVPERVLHEEVVEDLTTVRQRVVEIARPVYQERIVEVPEIEVVQRVVEVPEIIYQEKIREVPKIEVQERIIEIPRIVEQQRVVEVPEIEYHEVPVERLVEVPEVHEQVVIKQVPVPQYVEKSYPEIVNVEIQEDVLRQVPVPLEAVTVVELKVPKLRPRYTKVDIPLYVPRFIEIAMPAELMDSSAIAEAEHYAQQVTLLASQSAASLCEVERLAGALKELDGHYAEAAGKAGDFIGQNMAAAWADGRLAIEQNSVPHQRSRKPSFNASGSGSLVTNTPFNAPKNPLNGTEEPFCVVAERGGVGGPETDESKTTDDTRSEGRDTMERGISHESITAIKRSSVGGKAEDDDEGGETN